jgi:CRP-like cAMP-binding protein
LSVIGTHAGGAGAAIRWRIVNDRRSVVVEPRSPQQNKLLEALPAADLNRISPHLGLIELSVGQVLYEPGVAMHSAYFPTDSIVSLLYLMINGASAETGIIGNEGVVGVSLFMVGQGTRSRAVVQSAGYAYRLSRDSLRGEFERGGAMQHVLLCYTQSLIAQMAQTVACNRHHSIDQQLCRRLLLSLDRLESNKLEMTQMVLANMLGVRREGVNEAASKLQAAGLIEYSRGRITVLDRRGLEARTCECYAALRAEDDRLLPALPACRRAVKSVYRSNVMTKLTPGKVSNTRWVP